MHRKYKKLEQVFIAGLALLLVGAGAALAMQNPAIAKLAKAPLYAVAPKQATQELASNRPLVKIFLSGTLDRNHESVLVDKAGAVRPGEVVQFTVNSLNEGSAPARDYRAIGQIPRGTSFIGGSALAEGANAS